MNTPHDDESPAIVSGRREQIFHLLAEASEIEHTLMCSYLFAAFSLKRGDDSGLSADEQAAVDRWRQVILSVAIEEMVHLLLVANLATAVGGRPHFGRPNFPVDPGYFPAGVVVRLTRFSAETLDHFIYLERPRGEALSDAGPFETAVDYVREEAFDGLMPSIQDYSTVGGLYDALRANLVAATRRLGEADLFVGPVSAQVGLAVVDLPGVTTVASLAEACQVVDTIVEQGEGSPNEREDSHFQRFQAIRRELTELREKNSAFDPAWPVADNPVMRRPPQPEGKTFVDDRGAAQVLDLANAAYALLLQLVVQAFGRETGRAAALQARTLEAAIGLMHVLANVGERLVRLPATADGGACTAGVSFTMMRSVEPYFTGEVEEKLVFERLRELMGGARAAARIDPELSLVGDRLEAIARAYSTNGQVRGDRAGD